MATPHPLYISHGPRLPTQPTQAGRRTERLLAVGEHRLLVLSPKKKLSLAMGIGGSGGATVGGSRLQWRVCFWHELLSCAGSADDPCRLRLCFVPQTARSAALPPLFAARLAGLPSQPVAHDEIWQLLLEVRIGTRLGRGAARTRSAIAPRSSHLSPSLP